MRPPSDAKINDRETFTGLVETASEMKEITSDLGIGVSTGGMPHRRELAKVTMAWKRAKAQAGVKEQTEALQKQHGERITLLPEDWTSIMSSSRQSTGTTVLTASRRHKRTLKTSTRDLQPAC